MDPTELLTLESAARLARVSEASLRKKIDAGQLLVETRREGGKAVQMLRAKDLAEAYPDAFGAARATNGRPAAAARAAEPGLAQARPASEMQLALTEERTRREALEMRIGDLTTQLQAAHAEKLALIRYNQRFIEAGGERDATDGLEIARAAVAKEWRGVRWTMALVLLALAVSIVTMLRRASVGESLAAEKNHAITALQKDLDRAREDVAALREDADTARGAARDAERQVRDQSALVEESRREAHGLRAEINEAESEVLAARREALEQARAAQRLEQARDGALFERDRTRTELEDARREAQALALARLAAEDEARSERERAVRLARELEDAKRARITGHLLRKRVFGIPLLWIGAKLAWGAGS